MARRGWRRWRGGLKRKTPMSVVIRVENLSKYYRLGEIGGGTLREDLNRWWARVRGRTEPYWLA